MIDYKKDIFKMILIYVLVRIVTTLPEVAEKFYLDIVLSCITFLTLLTAVMIFRSLIRTKNDNTFIRTMLMVNKDIIPTPMLWTQSVIMFYMINIVAFASAGFMYSVAVWAMLAAAMTTVHSRSRRLLSKESIAKYHRRIFDYYEDLMKSITESESEELLSGVINTIRAEYNLPPIVVTDENKTELINDLKSAVYGSHGNDSMALIQRIINIGKAA